MYVRPHLTTAIASLWRLERFSQPHKAATNVATDDDEVGAGFGDVNVGDRYIGSPSDFEKEVGWGTRLGDRRSYS